MRILFFNRSASPAGGSMNRMVLDTARRLRAGGHEVALVHGREAGGQFDGTGYIYEDLDYRLLPRDQNALRLEAILEDFSPDVVQLHGVGNTLLDGWLAARRPTARFVHNHEFYCSGRRLALSRPTALCSRPHGKACCLSHWTRGCGEVNPVLNFVRYRATTRSLAGVRSAHALQACSDAVCRQLEANGIPRDKIVRLPAYAPAPSAAKGATGPTGRSILHVGGLLGHKGVWMIVRMLRVLPADVQLVFAGGGREQDMLESHVRQRGLGSRVRVVGDPTPHQWGLLYREATMVVMPVLWNEPLGLDGLAALAHGKPVVAFGTVGISEWLVDGENGVCVPFGQRPAFRDAVRGLLENPDRLRAMGRRARQIWEERFRPEAHLRALVANYEKLCREVSP